MKRVAFIGAFDPDYTRHAVIRTGLEQNGVEVRLLAIPKNSNTLLRIQHLIRSFRQVRDCDLVFIPAFNQLTVPLAWLLGHVYRKRVVVDYLVGLTDLIADRGQVARWREWLYKRIDRFNTQRLTTLTDTQAHKTIFQKLWGGKLEKMHILPVGYREALQVAMKDPPVDSFVAQYLGSFIPFHHVETIIRAADLLREMPQIQFELIGDGQTFEVNRQLAESLALENVRFVKGFIQPPELLDILSRASLFLGVFGDSEKTLYVVPTKVYESMVLKRPIVTADSPALREFFTVGEHLVTVASNDPQALAEAIRELAEDRDLRKRLARQGAEKVQHEFSPKRIGEQLLAILESFKA